MTVWFYNFNRMDHGRAADEQETEIVMYLRCLILRLGNCLWLSFEHRSLIRQLWSKHDRKLLSLHHSRDAESTLADLCTCITLQVGGKSLVSLGPILVNSDTKINGLDK